MAALTKTRLTQERSADLRTFAVKANVQIHEGALVALDGGMAVPGREDDDLVPVGKARESVTGGPNDGDATISVKSGCFLFANSAGADAVGLADLGQTCFIVDDQTVAKTHNTNARSPAGTVFDVDASGVWIKI